MTMKQNTPTLPTTTKQTTTTQTTTTTTTTTIGDFKHNCHEMGKVWLT